MALARGRRTDRRIDYWPGFVDALSTLLLAIMFLLSVFVLAQFLLSREITGKDEVLNRLNSQINELTQLLSLERSNTQDTQDLLANLQASLTAAEVEKTRLEQLLAQGAGADAAGNHAHRHAVGRSRQRARSQPARAVAGRTAQPADRRAAQADRRARTRAQRLRNARPRIQHQDRRPRPPPQRRAGAARAGAQPLPLGLLRPAARDPVRPREHPHRRRSLRLPVGGAFPVGSEVINEAGQVEMKKLADAIIELQKEIPPEINWVLRVDGHTDNKPLSGHRPLPRQLGVVLGARDLGGEVPDRQWRSGQPAGRGRLRRVPAARCGRHRRGAQ